MFSVGSGSAAAAAPALEPKLQPQERIPPPLFAGREKQKLILCLALVAVTLVVYNPVAHNGFIVFDDAPYIVNNPHVRSGITWSTVKWAFTFYSANWHPLTWLSHALDCQLFGLNPTGHHYVSLVFHAANAVLLFLILEEGTALAWPSLIVSAIFALHPVNVESVAWAAERKNVLSMFFFLLAMLVYGRYARRGGVGRYLAVNACFVLGMMSKSQIVTLPFVLLLWDYWPLKRMFGQSQRSPGHPPDPTPQFSFLLIEKIPLFAIALAGSIVTMLAQRSGAAVRTLSEFSLKARLENVLVSYAKYLQLLVWPRHLAPLYPHPQHGIPLWHIVASSLVLLGLTAIVLWRRERRYLVMGWLWYLGVLVPMIGIVQVGDQALADRYLYIPMIGILIAVVWFVWELISENAFSKVWIAIPATTILVALGALTYHQLGYWKDGETIWRYTLSVTEGNYVAHEMLGLVYLEQGRQEESISELLKGEPLHSYPMKEVFGLGGYVQRYGHLQDAARLYAEVARKATDADLRSAALSRIGIIDAQTKDYVQAEANYQHAIEIDPKNVDAFVGTALLAERDGDFEQAIAQLSRSVKIRADDVPFLLLEDALDRAGRASEALEAEQSAEKVSSDIAQARRNAAEMEKMFGLAPVRDIALAR
jgi:protein O-mannosyl-transferase